MPKLKFVKSGDAVNAELTDSDGDKLGVSVTYGMKPDDFALVLDVNGEMVGLGSRQAITLAFAILKEATRGCRT